MQTHTISRFTKVNSGFGKSNRRVSQETHNSENSQNEIAFGNPIEIDKSKNEFIEKELVEGGISDSNAAEVLSSTNFTLNDFFEDVFG